MVSEWTVREHAILLGITFVFLGGAYLLAGTLEVVSAVIGLLVLGLWLLGASGKLGISSLR